MNGATHPGLRRSLGYWDLVVYGLAYIAPITPLSTLGYVWQASNGLIVLAYVLGSICMFFTARSYAVMTDAVPSAGSVYGFARQALGPSAGFVAGWMVLLDYLLIPAFLYLLVAVAAEQLLAGVDRSVWIVIFAVFTLAVNWFGVSVTTRANFVAVGIQVLTVALFVALGLTALAHGFGNARLSLAPLYSSASFSAAGVFAATSICIMSFLGFDAVSTLSEEVRGQDRQLVGKAIVAVLAIAAVYFVAVTWVLGNLLPGVRIKDPASAAYELATAAIGAWAALALAWVYALVVGLSNALPMQVGVARVLFAMARDRQLPHVMARVHARYATPWVAMLVATAVSLAVALGLRNRLDELASIVNFGALSAFLFLHVSVVVEFGWRRRSRRWLAHWIGPILGAVVVCAVMAGMSHTATVVGLGWLGIGIARAAQLRMRAA